MSLLPVHNLTQGKRQFWQVPLALLLYGLVVLAGVAPGASADLPVKPYLTPKIDRFVVAAPKGDSLTATTKDTDCGADGADPHDQAWPPALAEIVFPIITALPSIRAVALPPQRNVPYLLQPSRAPPLA